MQITRPTLLIDEHKCKRNIERMFNKTYKNQIDFRPHFKTHQSAFVGNWFRETKVNKITVSSVNMATYFVSHGWNDITIAFPVNIREIDEINRLAESINLTLLAESISSITYLEKHLKSYCNVFLKIDTGYHRTGIGSDQTDEIEKLLLEIRKSNKINFTGFLAHYGHTYKAKSRSEIEEIFTSGNRQLMQLKARFQPLFDSDIIISIGDTPSCSIMNEFDGIDEIRPGNFVFYDLMQYQLGSCSFDDIACMMACPVVARHKDRNELVIYGGGVHFSKENIEINRQPAYGQIVSFDGHSWTKPTQDAYVKTLSQEHGIITLPSAEFDKYKIGDLIGIIPVHSCLTVSCIQHYYSTKGELLK